MKKSGKLLGILAVLAVATTLAEAKGGNGNGGGGNGDQTRERKRDCTQTCDQAGTQQRDQTRARDGSCGK